MKYYKLYENFNNDEESFSDSVIVDSEGELLELYHGTDTKFESFNEEYQRNGWLGKGFYFTDDINYAKENGKYVIKAVLNIKNPFYVEGEAPNDVFTEINKKYNTSEFVNDKLEEMLKENGHDGVIFKHWDIGNMYSCFYPNQIKIVG